MPQARLVSLGLLEIATLSRLTGAPKFKIRAFEQAAEVVNRLGDELARAIDDDRLRELQGIGPVLSEQIRELWFTGNSGLLARLRAAHPEGAGTLLQLDGVTPRRLQALQAGLGIRSVEELLAACIAGIVRGLPGFGEKTEARLLAACQRWLDPVDRTPSPSPLLLSRAVALAASLERELLEVVSEVHWVGALRRGHELVNRLELVVVGELEPALRRLSRSPHVVRVDASRRVAALMAGVELELSAVPAEALGRELVLRTGSAEHVGALCRRSESRETTLDAELGASEAGVYERLGLAYVPPELREGRGELERAETVGFAELLQLSDVQGAVHCHTLHSDGKNSVEEMARAAHALGMKYITITDHSPHAHYARGVSVDGLKRQWDEIAAAEARVPIRILRGLEADILPDGSLDVPDDVLEQLDVVIASIHARHGMDATRMTERLVRAMTAPCFKIWGHPLGRILNQRPPIECDVLAVLDALAASRGAIELNADPHRLDLPPELIPAASARNIPFVVAVDAHSVRGFDVLRFGVTMARRGDLRRDRVLNAGPPEQFARVVRPR